MLLSKKDWAFLAIVSLVLAVLVALGQLVLDQAGAFVVPVGTVIILATLVAIYRRLLAPLQEQARKWKDLRHTQHQDYRQLESLVSLVSVLDVRCPLPPMRGWAISPDFASLMVTSILSRQPDMIVETGSGVSTLVAAYALRKIGKGTVISLEHDGDFARRTSQALAEHGLGRYAQVVHAPLRDIRIGDNTWLWYDTGSLDHNTQVDMLVIDGPPGRFGTMIRYPALPVLLPLLVDRAIVLIDDASRESEASIIDRWLQEQPEFTCERVETETGAAILSRTASSANEQQEQAGVNGARKAAQ